MRHRSSLRSRVLVAVIAVAAVIMAAGCGSEPKTIFVWHSYRHESERALEELGERFEREHGVRVEILAVPYDAFSAKLEAAAPKR